MTLVRSVLIVLASALVLLPTAVATARNFETAALDTGCPPGSPGEPCWTITLLQVAPGDEVTVVANLTPSAIPHNIKFAAPIDKATPLETGTLQTLTFTVPEDFAEPIEFVCEVHPQTMIGQLLPPGATAGGAEEHVEIHSLGVNYLAYWVGVIAFAVMFVVYGLVFFLFKYGETTHTTDHKDRAGAPQPGALGRPYVGSILVILLSFVAIVVILFLTGNVKLGA